MLNSLIFLFAHILKFHSHTLNFWSSYSISSPESHIPGYTRPFYTSPKSQGKAMGPWLPTMQDSEQRKPLVCSGLPVQKQDGN